MTSLDRVGIRRIILGIKKVVSETIEGYLFEPNDEKTRASLGGAVNGYLEHLKDIGVFYRFKVVCDETNNSPKTIDQNMLNMDLHLQPNKSIEFLTLNFVTSRTGSTFDVLEKEVQFKSEVDEYLDRLGL